MKRGIRMLAFLLVLVCLYAWADGVLQTKTTDGIGTMTKFYELPADTVDVLMTGSSHMGMNMDPTILWDEFGIAGYNLWSGMQPIWNSYYFVKEGMKYQQPKLVVVNVFLCSVLNEFSDSSVALKSVQAMKPSIDKFKAAFVSFPTWQQAVEALWGMPTYHTRFDELTEQDFTYDEYAQELTLRQINEESTLTQEQAPYQIRMLDYASISDSLSLSEKSEKYLRMLIELCRAKDTQLLLIAAPFEATADEYRRLNRVGEIAAEYDVPYLNFLTDLDAFDIDPTTDFWDVSHLNTHGIPKFTRALGEYFISHFELPDRREDAAHIWATEGDAQIGTDAAWKMETQFSGDGVSRYVDTGIKLYENRYGSWTLLTRLNMAQHAGEEVYISNFCETPGAGNYGLLIRRKTDDCLAVKLGNNIDVDINVDADFINLAIIKDVEKYTVYANGKCIVKDYELPCPAAYTGHLLIGCQELAPEGEKFRFSSTEVNDLVVYERVFSESEALSWQPAVLPRMPLPMGMDGKVEAVYTMEEQFVGNNDGLVQADYVDTGVQLYAEAATRFTVLARLTPDGGVGDGVYLSAFSEVPGEYRGLLVRQTSANTMNLVLGNNFGVNIDCVIGQPLDLAIVKDLDVYRVYANGELQHELTSPCAPYSGTLLVGAQRDAQDNIFRRSTTRVNSLTVLSGAMDQEAIRGWDFSDAAMPQERVPASVAYKLENAFLGNGQDRYIDTGVQLYDMTGKDWTLSATIRVESGKYNGVYMSCFSEEAGRYRGFMLRQDAADSLTLFVGNAMTHQIALSDSERIMRLVVVKQGSTYTLYRNGKAEATLQSDCDSYEGTLLIGCQETAEGEMFRFSTAKVDDVQLWDGAAPADDALAMSVMKETESRFE